MFRYIGGLIGCARGRHERSQEHIHKVGEELFSRCRYCRTTLRRRAKRDWVVADGD